jgi:hypothetical protein
MNAPFFLQHLQNNVSTNWSKFQLLDYSFLSHTGVPVSTGITCQPAELAGLKNNPLWHIRA